MYIKPIICKLCNQPIASPTSRSQKFHPDCSLIRKQQKRKEWWIMKKNRRYTLDQISLDIAKVRDEVQPMMDAIREVKRYKEEVQKVAEEVKPMLLEYLKQESQVILEREFDKWRRKEENGLREIEL